MKQTDLGVQLYKGSEVPFKQRAPWKFVMQKNYLITITHKNDPSHCPGFLLTVVFEEDI